MLILQKSASKNSSSVFRKLDFKSKTRDSICICTEARDQESKVSLVTKASSPSSENMGLSSRDFFILNFTCWIRYPWYQSWCWKIWLHRDPILLNLYIFRKSRNSRQICEMFFFKPVNQHTFIREFISFNRNLILLL